ncbi:MAG: class I adenylate-forming enzyme family protein [Candidatus Lernaella stagnicola]|nr:class I adenylate-forming enzyme family protein [Candidatus Lernaella stagnicola]
MNAASAYLDAPAAAPDRVAICEPSGRAITYADLLRRVVALAEDLQARGMTPGDRVVLQVPNGIEFAVTALATLLVGGVPLLIEPGLGDEVYLSRVKVSEPRWLLVHPLISWLNRIPGARSFLQRRELDVPPVPPLTGDMQKVVITAKRIERLAAGDVAVESFVPVERKPEDDGIIVFTGGTTSLPKGVRLSHGALGQYIANISSAVEGQVLENFLADTPQQVLYALRLGKTAYITKGRKQKRARHVLSLIRAGAIDAYFGSPYVWMEMMSQAGPDSAHLPNSMRTVLLGGAPVTADFLRVLSNWLAPGTAILALYGMTEAGPVCAVRAEEKIAYDGDGDIVGKTLTDVRVEITNANENGVGDVVVHSPSLYSGYLGQEPRGAEEGLQTGDLGRIVEFAGQPMLTLLGRAKDMIIRNGVNIYPASFEAAIREIADHAGRRLLRECAMVGLWNPTRQDEDVVLCLQPAAGVDLSVESIKDDVTHLCGTDAKPDHFLLLDPIPVTGRQNKVDKKAVREYASRELSLPLRQEEAR